MKTFYCGNSLYKFYFVEYLKQLLKPNRRAGTVFVAKDVGATVELCVFVNCEPVLI